MSTRFILGRENVPCVAEVVNRSLKADCTDFTHYGTSSAAALLAENINSASLLEIEDNNSISFGSAFKNVSEQK